MFSRLFTAGALPTLTSTFKLHFKEHPKYAQDIISRLGNLQTFSHFIDKVVCDKKNRLDIYVEIALTLKNEIHLIEHVIDRLLSYINGFKNDHALRALELLDVCMLNSGYSFVIQMASRDNLNLLVKRFPVKPPERYDDVIQRIIQLVLKWTTMFATDEPASVNGNGATKEMTNEFKNIRAMQRLLQSKGYKQIQQDRASSSNSTAALNPVPTSQLSNLKSSEELTKERKDFQEAKLRELIRRGRPADLAKANDLMRTISGFEGKSTQLNNDSFASELKWIEESLGRIFSSIKICTCLQDLYLIQDIENSIEFCKVIQVKSENILAKEENEAYIRFLLKISENAQQILELYETLTKTGKNSVKLIDFSDPTDNPIAPPASTASNSPPFFYRNTNNSHFDLECKVSALNNQINLFFNFSVKNKMSKLDNFTFQLASTKQTTLEMGNLSSTAMDPSITQHSIVYWHGDLDPQKIMLKYKITYNYFGTPNATEGLIKLFESVQ